MKIIYNYNEYLDEDLFGSKFSNLHILSKNQIVVPPFFCLSSDVFKVVFSPIKDRVYAIIDTINWNESSSLDLKSNQIKELFTNQKLDQSVLQRIELAFDQYIGADEFCSVRSCVRSDSLELKEDSSDNAFAGMSESIMFVKKSNLQNSILTCLSSCFSKQVLIYRSKLSLPQKGMEVVIGIQKMIRAKKSFIMFSKDPLDFKNQCIISCGFGTGEGIVQGKIESDHFTVDNKTGSISSIIAEKTLLMDFNEQAGFGVELQTLQTHLAHTPTLTEQEILALANMAKKIEKIKKFPQDIEGCFDHNGQLYILQSRPIVLDRENITTWSSLNVSESYPGVSSPLTFSFAQKFYQRIFYDCYLLFGVSRKTLLENELYLSNMLGHLNGKIHYNLGNFYRLHGLSPLFPLFRSSWEDMIGLNMGLLITNKKNKTREKVDLIIGVFRTIYLLISHQTNFSRFYKWWNHLFKATNIKISKESDNALKLYNTFFNLWKEVESNWGITLVNDVFMGMGQSILEKLVKSIEPQNPMELLSDLLCGGKNPISVEAMHESIKIAQSIKSCQEHLNLINSTHSNEFIKIIQNDQRYIGLNKSIFTYLEKYGYRGLQELKLENLPPINKPEIYIDLLKSQVNNLSDLGNLQNNDNYRLQCAKIKLKELTSPLSIKRYLILLLSRYQRNLVVQRENSRYARSELFGMSRNIYLLIAKEFLKSGILSHEDDIFFCTYEEIEGVIIGTSSLENLKAVVSERKTIFSKHSEEFSKQTFSTGGPLYLKDFELMSTSAVEDKNILQGLGSAKGTVTGRARIVINPDPDIKLSLDEILVAKETDPGWLFLMISAKGMVVERGSMLSHTAITGRKLGIPTVVGVQHATKFIKDGDLITLNGSNGTILIHRE